MSNKVSCKELIEMFVKMGGKLVFEHDTRQYSYFQQPRPITTKLTKINGSIDKLLSNFVNSGSVDKYVKILPETERSKKNMFVKDKLYDCQEKNTCGFSIKFDKYK
jgi:hypothetical protein